MQKKTRRISMLLALIIVVSMGLAGCGSTPPASSPSELVSTAPVEPVSEAEEALELVELTMYVDGTPQPDTPQVMAAINEVLREKINATLNLIEIDWGSYADKMKVITASGEPYDIAYTSTWATNYPVEMQKDTYMPINDLLDKYGSNITALIPEEVWPAVTYKGNIYGIPSLGGYGIPKGIVVKKDLAEKYNLDINSITKFSDLEPFLESVKQNEASITPFFSYVPIDDPLYIMATAGFDVNTKYDMVTNNVFYDTATNKAFSISEAPEFVESLKILAEWYSKGYIRKDAATVKDTYTEMKTGQYAAATYNWCIGDGGTKLTKEFGVEYLEKITTPGGMIGTSTFQNNVVAIGANSKNPERAMMFLNLLNDRNDTWLYNTLAAGLENEHYNVVGDKTVEYIDKSGYDNHLAWEFGNMLCKWYTPEEGPDFIAKEEQYANEAIMSPILGFTISLDPMKNEAAKVESVFQEYKLILTNGMTTQSAPDIESLVAEYNQKLRDSGIDKIIAETQTQIDQWKAENGK